MEVFHSLREVQQLASRWREEYNHKRPHGSLNYMTPASFGGFCRGGVSAPLGSAAATARGQAAIFMCAKTLITSGPKIGGLTRALVRCYRFRGLLSTGMYIQVPGRKKKCVSFSLTYTVFRKYVSPNTPVEMLKKKTKATWICEEFGKGFRPIVEVQKAFLSRPMPDEALCAVLWEYKDRGKKGYDLTEGSGSLPQHQFFDIPG